MFKSIWQFQYTFYTAKVGNCPGGNDTIAPRVEYHLQYFHRLRVQRVVIASLSQDRLRKGGMRTPWGEAAGQRRASLPHNSRRCCMLSEGLAQADLGGHWHRRYRHGGSTILSIRPAARPEFKCGCVLARMSQTRPSDTAPVNLCSNNQTHTARSRLSSYARDVFNAMGTPKLGRVRSQTRQLTWACMRPSLNAPIVQV